MELVLTAKDCAEGVGAPADRIVEVATMGAVTMQDGIVAVLQSVELQDRVYAGHLLWAIRPDGTASATHLGEDMAPVGKTQISIAAMGDCVAVHVLPLHQPDLSASVLLVPWLDGDWGAVQPLDLIRPLPEAKARQGFMVQVEPSRRGFGDGSVAAFAISTSRGDETTRTGAVAFLAVDRDAGTARWRVWPSEGEETPKGGGLLSRVLGRKKPTPLALLRNDSFPALEGWDYPCWKGDPTIIGASEAAWVDGRVVLHTPGAGGTLKYGWRCDALAEMDRNGRELRRIRFEDFVNHPEANRKHGRNATCVNGGRHWVISSAYKATDPLKGKMALVDTATGQERVIVPPKAVSQGNWHQRNPVEVTESYAVWMMQNDDEVSHSVWLTPLP